MNLFVCRYQEIFFYYLEIQKQVINAFIILESLNIKHKIFSSILQNYKKPKEISVQVFFLNNTT